MKTNLTSMGFRRLAFWTGGLMTALLLATFVFISVQIGVGVREISATAMQDHSGDRVEALIEYVEDPGHSLRDRNRAVWALG